MTVLETLELTATSMKGKRETVFNDELQKSKAAHKPALDKFIATKEAELADAKRRLDVAFSEDIKAETDRVNAIAQSEAESSVYILDKQIRSVDEAIAGLKA